MLFVIGPGHGAPAALACLWLEGSLERFYPKKYPTNKQGLHNLVTKFSLPGAFPRCVSEMGSIEHQAFANTSSHINPETPGAIHEGGELGYALAVSFGAVMDNPDLVVTCVVGDGEAESGPTAAYVYNLSFAAFVNISQGMALYQIFRPSGVWGSHSNSSRKWLQNKRAHDIWLHGQQGACGVIFRLRLPSLHC